MQMIKLPKAVLAVCEAINTKGRALLVGGFVRDTLLGFKSYDIDIEVYELEELHTLKELLRAFGSVHEVGKAFGVLSFSYEAFSFDVALARKENSIGIGHKDFTITLAAHASFKEIALRRDFTINAMGFDTKKRRFLDPFNGQKDLQTQTLRMVNPNRFGEDPLRILRAAGFASRFKLRIDPALKHKAKALSHTLLKLSNERLFSEIYKWFEKGDKASLGIRFLREIKAPILKNSDSSLIAFNKAEKSFFNRLILLYSAQDEQTFEKELFFITSPKLKKKLLHYHHYYRLFTTTHLSDLELQLLAQKLEYPKLLKLLFSTHSTQAKALKKRVKDLGVYDQAHEPLIKGDDLIKLGLKPGIHFGDILKKCYRYQLQTHADKPTLLAYIKSIP